jgi:cell fate regulator YaaT (PSP1 superfamily)
MAKQQNIPLNPTKIVGSCGRLLCCLAYEAEPGQKREKKTVAPASVEENSDASEELLAEEVIPEPGAVISETQPTENSIE